MSKALETFKKVKAQNFIPREYEEVIEKALTPPTADEVCEEFKKHHEDVGTVFYDKKSKLFYLEERKEDFFLASSYHDERGHILVDVEGDDLPSNLLIMLGKFYEGLEE